ncbi:hypothetical protein TIFTF001_041049, partial [Ficus carica]
MIMDHKKKMGQRPENCDAQLAIWCCWCPILTITITITHTITLTI